MNRKEILLAVLAASNSDAYEPVQLQKVMFLIDKKLQGKIADIPFFNFEPYAFGPFDKEVYRTVENLRTEGLADINYHTDKRIKLYRATARGLEKGNEILSKIDGKVSDFIRGLSEFVRRLTFDELVMVIYKEYPEMKVNSVFRG